MAILHLHEMGKVSTNLQSINLKNSSYQITVGLGPCIFRSGSRNRFLLSHFALACRISVSIDVVVVAVKVAVARRRS
jgi:hypothetical protein